MVEFDEKLEEYPNMTLMEQWGYMFYKGEKVKFHPQLKLFTNYYDWNNHEIVDPTDFKDKIGIVKDCNCELHAYAQGCIYFCDVDFDGIMVRSFAGFFINVL